MAEPSSKRIKAEELTEENDRTRAGSEEQESKGPAQEYSSRRNLSYDDLMDRCINKATHGNDEEGDLKGVVHKPTKGVPAAAQPLPGRGGLSCYRRPSMAEGCMRSAHHSGVSCSMLLGGTIELRDVPGAHLDYAVEFHIGVIVGDELWDPPPEIDPPGYYSPAVAMNVYETFVPQDCRGQGIGRRLARAVFKVAELYGFFVLPTCTYIADSFLRGETAKEFDRRVLFTATAEGRGVAARRAELTAMTIPTLKAMGGHRRNRNNNKPIMVERLLHEEFGERRRLDDLTAAGEERCRSVRGLGCGGCAACGGRGYCGYDHPIPPDHTSLLPPDHARFILYNNGPNFAKWGPPPWIKELGYHGANEIGPYRYESGSESDG